MKNTIFCLIAAILSTRIFGGHITAGQASIVGYSNSLLNKGNNRVEINFDAVKPLFSTMDMILNFSPVDGIIGDEIEFILDGKNHRYVFDSFDGTNYVLSAVTKGTPIHTTFDAIPWMPVVWIKHKNGKDVLLTQAGNIEGEHAKHEHKDDQTNIPTAKSEGLKIKLVGNNDWQQSKEVRLKGGHIRISKNRPADG